MAQTQPSISKLSPLATLVPYVPWPLAPMAGAPSPRLKTASCESGTSRRRSSAGTESERHVLLHVVESLLARDLALRERIKGEDYLVFPSQCTAELRFPGAAVFGVAFGFAGPVRSIYATLIAQLAHYEGFKKREFFQDAAAYRAEAGGLCLVRLKDHGRGKGELEVLFESETPANVR